MGTLDFFKVNFLFPLLICGLTITYAQFYGNSVEDFRPKIENLKWCVVGIPEYKKCMAFAAAVKEDKSEFRDYFFEIKCINGSGKYDCMRTIEEEKADITTLDSGEVFSAGRYYSLVPILQESYPGLLKNYFAVAVIKRRSMPEVSHLRHLRGKKACFPSVESLAGWMIPIAELMKRGGLEVIDCNNHVKNAVNFFGPSCAVNSLLDKYNPIGDNSDKLCKLCIGKVPGGKCTSTDPYAGFTGSFRCLLEAGEIAFLKHTTVVELANDKHNFPTVNKTDFELICLDGSRRTIDDYVQCSWGKVPSHAVVTSSAKSVKTRRAYQKFLEKTFELYGPTSSERPNRYNYTTGNQFDRGNPYSQDENRRDFGRDGNYGGQNWRDRNYERENYGRGEGDRERGFDRENNRDEYGREVPRDEYGRPIGRDENGRDRNGLFRNESRDEYGREYSSTSRDNIYNEYRTSTESTFYGRFQLFESVPRYGLEHDLLFSESTEQLAPISEGVQTFKEYLGKSFDTILELRNCPVKAVTLCVTSDAEIEKCFKMRTALKAQLLEPELVCYKGHSHIHCMQAIRNGDADISVFDAGDIYTAGLNYRLVPIMAEVYNLGVPEYYAVAVAKEEDPDTEITYLRGKNTCHSGVNTGAGWVVPMAFLISNGWIRSYGCDSMKAAAEYFSKMCLPGSQSTEYNIGQYVPYDNMCQLCHGPSYRYCHRDASEDYYGHTGAFRCLVEGGGDVAFIKHTTVSENTDGKRKEWWARNTLKDDFQLLCPDGTRSTMDNYMQCNLGRVKANAIVTRGGDAYNITQINAYINLFTYAQQFYGKKDEDEFNFAMFHSQPPYADLIFQDATTQLQVVPPALRWYSDYLGKDFMRAKRIVDCYAGASQIVVSFALLLSSVFLLSFLH